MQIPVIQTADVVIFGARSGAVAAALAAKQAGRSVFALSDRAYFGEETAGALQLWPEQGLADLLRPLRIGGGGSEGALDEGSSESVTGAVTSRYVKHTLELALLHHDIPFLFQSRPVALLYDEHGALAGLVIAARSALMAVLGRVFVDASRTGLLARLAKLPLTRRPGPSRRSLMVIGTRPPETGFTWEEVRSGLIPEAGNWPEPLSAYRIDVPLSADHTLPSTLAADYMDLTRIHYPGLHIAADTWTEIPTDSLAKDPKTLHDHWSDLSDSAFSYRDGRLLVMNELLPISSDGARVLGTLEGQLYCGKRIGRLAAAHAASLPVPGRIVGSTGPAARYGFSTPFLRPQESQLTVDVQLAEFATVATCDVLVAGGGTAGASAGIAAARAGADTIVLERLNGLGGLGTMGLISAYYLGNRTGFTSEIDAQVLRPREPGKKGSNRWNPSRKQHWYLNALGEAGGVAWFGSFAFGAQMDGSTLSGVLVSTPYGPGLVRTHTAIDATGNADVAAAAGVPCREIGATHIAVQGTGLGPQKLGQIYSNTDWTFIDENDPLGITHAFVAARAKFQQAFDVVPLIGTRERRQIVGEIELSPVDFLTGRTFPDTIVTARSNFDSHGFTIHPAFAVSPPDKTVLTAHVPFRCLLPRNVEGLLVTGLGVSAHRDVLPVIRMQADVQNQGYAAGRAAALAAQDGCVVRKVDIRRLQRHLVDVGILEPEALTYDESFPLPEQVLREALAQGPLDVKATAIILNDPEKSAPALLQRLRDARDLQAASETAMLLGLWGYAEAAEALAALVDAGSWDEGWDFTGMGQFGMTLSRMDVLVMALGKTRSKVGIDPVLRKIGGLDEGSAFSHCRAVSVAASALRDPSLAEGLYELLQKPGMQGHVHLNTLQVMAQLTDEPNETADRNASLRELILARGLYLCGDRHGLGKEILTAYTRDLRGHYARHAQAVLQHPDPGALGWEVL